MIIRYDLKRFFDEKGLKQAHFARKIGMSKQLFGYHIRKGDISLSMLTIIAEEMDITPKKLTDILNKEYVKVKI
jgi:transcriptional regulator with XRE-family HTH domain